MAFIRAALSANGTQMAFNVDQIAFVIDGSSQAGIVMTAADKHGQNEFWVADVYADIMKKIETAQVYGPK